MGEYRLFQQFAMLSFSGQTIRLQKIIVHFIECGFSEISYIVFDKRRGIVVNIDKLDSFVLNCLVHDYSYLHCCSR